MPLPLARCAFSRSSGGTSIVILREVGMTPQYTISDTSIEYGVRARRHRGDHRAGLPGEDRKPEEFDGVEPGEWPTRAETRKGGDVFQRDGSNGGSRGG